MKIHLPNSAFLGNIDPFLRAFDPSHPDRLEISANKRWISLHPLALAMTAALGLTVRPERILIETLEARSSHYLVRMGLFAMLGLPIDIAVTEHEPAGRFIPLTRITDSQQLTDFMTDMIPLLHVALEPTKTLGYIVSELVRNVLEHAAASNGAIICAQYYAKSNAIRIGIADTGVGIRRTINRSYPTHTDLEAIQLALTPGITGTTRREGGTEQNAGAGLFFIKSIASVNRDFFVLYSGSALYKLLSATTKKIILHADPFDDRHSKRDDLPDWHGTAVGIDISLNQTPAFVALLDAIDATYSRAVAERKKARYRKARFT